MTVHRGLKVKEKIRLRTLMDRSRVELGRVTPALFSVVEAVEALLKELERYTQFGYETENGEQKPKYERDKEVFKVANHTTGIVGEVHGWEDLAKLTGLGKPTLIVYFSRSLDKSSITRTVRGDVCTIFRSSKVDELANQFPVPKETPAVDQVEKSKKKYRTPLPKGAGSEE
jgi:hypothetical protein